MFSSISNFLPASLHSSTPQKADHIRVEDEEEDDPGSKSDTNETGVLKKKKDKSANETFIFVRPPPAKSNHPLNLQVQLVPPNSRGPSGLTSASRQSLDLSASAPVTPANSTPTTPVDTEAVPVTATNYESGAPLTRTASNRSTASSTYSSTSTASTSSTASSRRMIVPLYNLQAHNVMTNIIVDAGTDAKIARFTKRGIEMLDLAVLEPIEVYAGGGAPMGGDASHAHGSGFSNRTVGGRPSISDRLSVPGGAGGGSSRPATPDPTNSSQASLASSSAHSHHSRSFSHGHEVVTTPQASVSLAPGTPQGTPQKRNVFGRLFKKKDAPSPSESAASLTPTPMGVSHTRTLSALGARPVSPNPSVLAAPRASISSARERSSIDLGGGGEEIPVVVPAVGVRAPILGLQASVSSPVHPPRGRPGLYVWVVRRWMKGEGGGLLAVAKGMVKGQGGDDLTSEVEVRFEWKRGKAKRRKEKEGEDGEHKTSRRQASTANLTPSKRLSMSIISRQSSFSMLSTEDGHLVDSAARRRSIAHADEDSGDESDPEDSETPWTCTVKVRRLAMHHARARSHHAFGQDRGKEEREKEEKREREQQEKEWKKEVLRIKVGTLSPTPHHPKVVAMLKVPFPLPDVDVERMVVRKREAGQGSLNAMMKPGQGHGLMITAEEIKDVVCSTGLWLVVREGFGGIGKVSRKGDGWRLRG
ncbi:hypothetical protein C8F04DRAFT_1390348 [Mycena alexandri]|uniref:Uncharacterized protein n=1 Tax=Mycena alexandri TaxID=1745969 RepID=A0AAD6TCP3_9AGAR|nr:hypothetical protein C8F04DRAFT_1390348 [Mycena alexandri]